MGHKAECSSIRSESIPRVVGVPRADGAQGMAELWDRRVAGETSDIGTNARTRQRWRNVPWHGVPPYPRRACPTNGDNPAPRS